MTEAPPALPFVDLAAQRRRLGDTVERAILRVLDHGHFILGPEVAELERRLAAFSGARHAVTCASGTDSLHLGLRALGAGPGDAVFVPAFTFTATAEAVVLAGATPMFVDVRSDTFNMDADSLAAAVAGARDLGLNPRAVIPVDLFGQPADYRALGSVAEIRGLRILADAAQSFGATYLRRRVGTLADATATSFFPAKPLGCYGDGGAFLTDDEVLADSVRSLRAHGKGENKHDAVRIGTNSRLDTLQAAVLIEKLAIFEDEISRRQRIAERYTEALAGLARTPTVGAGATSVWAQYTIVLDGADRPDLRQHLAAAGVPTAVYYPRSLHRQAANAGFPTAPGGLPVSDELAARVLGLPMHPYLQPAQQDRIIAAVGGFFDS